MLKHYTKTSQTKFVPKFYNLQKPIWLRKISMGLDSLSQWGLAFFLLGPRGVLWTDHLLLFYLGGGLVWEAISQPNISAAAQLRRVGPIRRGAVWQPKVRHRRNRFFFLRLLRSPKFAVQRMSPPPHRARWTVAASSIAEQPPPFWQFTSTVVVVAIDASNRRPGHARSWWRWRLWLPNPWAWWRS
jgi:hypothetical protein